MQVTYTLEKGHVTEFQKHFVETSANFKAQVRRTRILLIVLCLAAVAFYWYQFMNKPGANWTAFAIPALVMIVITAFMVATRGESLKRRAMRAIQDSLARDGDKFTGEVQLSFDGKTFTEVRGGETLTIDLNDIRRVGKTDRLWLLYFTGAEALVIPRKAVEDQAEFQTVVTELSTVKA